jgi:hypothetical protein
MKLTNKLLKKLILEEIDQFNEQEEQADAAPADPKAAPEGGNDASKPEAAKSTTDLGDNLIALGRKLKQSKIKNIDKNEIALIEDALVSFLELSEKGSASSFLTKVQSIVSQKKSQG